MKKIVIAGTHSGCGKTTVSMGIMAALTKSGRHVTPFKVGPDYIDPAFHTFVTGNPAYNLDTWLVDDDTVRTLFERSVLPESFAVIEGVMGLFDGFGIDGGAGSTAHTAKVIDAPVILVVEAGAMSTSAAALVQGFKNFDSSLRLAGVIFNKVSSQAHYDLLKQVIERHVGIPCLGYLPKDESLSLKSRHLGLVPAGEVQALREKMDLLAERVAAFIDLEALEGLAASHTQASVSESSLLESEWHLMQGQYEGLRIGIARDEAFTFYYRHNLDLLDKLGVTCLPFSPLHDEALPSGLDGLYMGGGFPEVFGQQLMANTSMRAHLHASLTEGLPAYAECGGLMYLTDGIVDLDGQFWEMVGFFDARTIMTKRLQRFGYVEVTNQSGVQIRAHEFHHSKLELGSPPNFDYTVVRKRDYGKNPIQTWSCGLRQANVLAGYAHIHFYSNLAFLQAFLDRCASWRQAGNEAKG